VKQRKIPMRKCVACQEMMPKKSLMRIVRTPDHEVKWDPSGKVSGRGAYLCAKDSCLETAEKKKALERALKTDVSKEVYSILRQQIREWTEANHGS